MSFCFRIREKDIFLQHFSKNDISGKFMIIRKAFLNDLDTVSELEEICFPVSEAAPKTEFEERLKCYSDHFLLMFDGDRLVSLINGFVTDEPDLTDDMYKNAKWHNENGKWQMIFGVNTHPDYRKMGCAGTLINQFVNNAKDQNRLGVVLTCKEHLIDYYKKFGFACEGVTDKSTHGNNIWYQMRIVF